MNAKNCKRHVLRRIFAVILTVLLCQVMPVLPTSAAVTKGDPSEIMKNYSTLAISRYPTVPGSGFEFWGGHFQFDVLADKSAFNATSGIGTASSKWFFDLYYRPVGSSGEYDMVTCDLKDPQCYYDFGNGNVIYRLILNNTGFKRLQKTEYQMIVVARENTTVKGWVELFFEWNDATDDAFSKFTGEWPDYTMVGFKVPMKDTVTKYHLKEGDVPSYDGTTFRPGYVFVGWEADGTVYEGALPAVTKEVTYTAVYRSSDAGDVNGDGKITIKDAARVLMHLENAQIPVSAGAADIDGSGKVEISDVTALLQLIAKGALPGDPTVAALQGKTALFCGDSITMASTHDKDRQWWGWAGRIGNFYNMKSYVNAGVDGAAVSIMRPTNRVVTQLERNRSGKFDYVMLHGLTNDAWDSVAVGSMTAADCFDKTKFDTKTFAGGLEELFYTAKNYFPDAKIGYIINFRFYTGLSGYGRLNDMSEYVEVAKKICDKWDIPYLDLYANDEIYAALRPTISTHCIADSVHPNSNGYDVLYPYIADFMASLG